jgi:hypothetical protein
VVAFKAEIFANRNIFKLKIIFGCATIDYRKSYPGRRVKVKLCPYTP